MGIFTGVHIGVDQDEVLAHWNKGFAAAAVAKYPHISFPFLTENLNWSLEQGLDEEGVEAVKTLKNLEGFYFGLQPIDGAREALEEMEAEGAIVTIITAPTVSNRTCASDKLNWLEMYMGEGWGDKAIITGDKTMVMCDVLIDDRPEITGHYDPIWEQIVFDQPYNQKVTGKVRMKNWSQWKEAVSLVLNGHRPQ